MNKFNFNRFGKVVVRDLHSAYNLYGMSLLIMALVPAFMWLLGWAFKANEVAVFSRYNFIQFMVILAAAIAPMKIYNSCNLSGKGNYFAMLPATLGEKFWSMVLYSFVVSPLVVLVGAVAVDILLTLLPFGPFKEYIWQMPDWTYAIGGGFFGYTAGFNGFLMSIFKVLSIASLYLFANTIFKKNKFIKTILWLLLIGFVLTVIAVPIVSHIDWMENRGWLFKLAEWLKLKSEEQLVNLWHWTNIILNAVVTFLFSFFTYRRLKKMQY